MQTTNKAYEGMLVLKVKVISSPCPRPFMYENLNMLFSDTTEPF